MADSTRLPVSEMQPVTDLLDSDFFYLVRPTEPLRPDKGKRITWAALKVLTGEGGGGGEPGEPLTWTPRWDLFRGDGVTTRFPLTYDVAGPNECGINARVQVYNADYFFDFVTNELVFYDPPEEPAPGDDDNVAISYYQDVGGIAFLKENQGLQSVLGVGNAADIDMSLNASLFVNEVHTDNVALPPYATAAQGMIVAGNNFMRRMNFGAAFTFDYGTNTVNVSGGGGGGPSLSNFTWNEVGKELGGERSDSSVVPGITLTGIAMLTDIPTDFVKKSTGGQFDGRVNFDNGIRLTSSPDIFSPSLQTKIRLSSDEINFYTENAYRVGISQFGIDLFSSVITLNAAEIVLAQGADTSGGKMVAIDGNRRLYFADLPTPAGEVPKATETTLGIVRPGAGLAITDQGVLYTTGGGADGNNYPLGVSINASGVLTITRAGLSSITTNLYTNFDQRYLQITDYTPGGDGGGVSGPAGTVPVFDGSADGVGPSKISQDSNYVYMDSARVYLKSAINADVQIVHRDSGGTEINYLSLNQTGLLINNGGIITPNPLGGSIRHPWEMGNAVNSSDAPANRKIRVKISGNSYDILAVTV